MNCPSKVVLYNAVYKACGLQAVYSLAICLGGVYYLEDRDPAAQYVSEALWFHYCFVINSKAIQTAGLPEGKGSNKQTNCQHPESREHSLICPFPTLSKVTPKSSSERF